MTDDIQLRQAQLADLENINHLIEAAIMTWELPERVKRLALSSYQYSKTDFNFLHIIIAGRNEENILGIAAWEPADTKDIPENTHALLLHGIYVNPSHHHRGIGKQLFLEIEKIAREHHFDSILVKAQQGAEPFFIKQGMQRLAVENEKQQYANRFWKKI